MSDSMFSTFVIDINKHNTKIIIYLINTSFLQFYLLAQLER